MTSRSAQPSELRPLALSFSSSLASAFSAAPSRVVGLACAALLAACGGGGTEAPQVGADSAEARTMTAAAAKTSERNLVMGAAGNLVASGTVVVSASGMMAGNVGPTMQLWSHGTLIGSVEVRAGSAQDYSFTVPPTQLGDIDVVFTNNAVIGWEDRNLVVHGITVNGVRFTPQSAGVTYDRGDGAAAFDGIDVLGGTNILYWNGALRIPVPRQTFASGGAPGVYVDQVAGNDAQIGTIDFPWKTLRPLSTARLASGEGIYLRCGQVWRESATLTWWQLPRGAIVAGYGDCSSAKAEISGADDFSNGWTRSGNVWSRALPAGTPKIKRLFIDGAAARTAQWPNGTDDAHNFALVRPVTAPSSAAIRLTEADAATVRGRDLVGATALVRSLPWTIEKVEIGLYDESDRRMYFSYASQSEVHASEGFVLQDKLWMLDAPGEFYHDIATQRLYVYPSAAQAQAELNGRLVEGSVRDIPLTVKEQSDLVLTNLSLQKGRVTGLEATDTPTINISQVIASNNGGTGIALHQWQALSAGVAGPTITASTLDNNLSYGIDARFVSKAQITSNRVTRTGTNASAQGSSAGLAGGPGARVEANIVDGTGYHGIVYSGTGNSQVTRNTVTGYCRRLTDCGAIYTWNGPKNAINTVNQVSLIENNQIGPATPNLEGTAGGGHDTIAGIYLDDFSRGVTMRGNTVHGSPIGIFVHNGTNVTVDANRVWLPTQSAIWASMDQTDGDYMTGNMFSNNEIVPIGSASGALPALPTLTTTRAFSFYHHLHGVNAIRSGQNQFRNNRVYRLNGSNIETYSEIGSSSGQSNVTVAEWMALNPQEQAPLMPMTFATYSMSLGSELVSNMWLNQGAAGWNAYFGGGSGNAQQVTPAASFVMTSGTGGDLLYSAPFAMAPGVLHVYSYRATPNSNATVAQPYISRSVWPWDQMTPSYRSTSSRNGTSSSVVRYEAFFVPTSSAPARVNLMLETLSVPVLFDSVSVRPVTGMSFAQSSEWAAAVIAPQGQARTVSCADLGWAAGCQTVGLDGVALPMPRTVAAGTQQIFLRADSTWRR